jgi:hypothetical protein
MKGESFPRSPQINPLPSEHIDLYYPYHPRKVDIRLPAKGNSNFNDARPVY